MKVWFHVRQISSVFSYIREATSGNPLLIPLCYVFQPNSNFKRATFTINENYIVTGVGYVKANRLFFPTPVPALQLAAVLWPISPTLSAKLAAFTAKTNPALWLAVWRSGECPPDITSESCFSENAVFQLWDRYTETVDFPLLRWFPPVGVDM